MNVEIEEYFQDKMNTAEKVRLFRKLTFDKEMQTEFNRYKNTDALLAFSDVENNSSELKLKYKHFVSRMRRKKWKGYSLYFSTCAAVVLLLILSVHFYHVYFYQDQPPPVVAETSLFVPAGQRISLTLSDGTTVWLNAQSRLTYPSVFVGDQRRVAIDGEAFFEVAKNVDKPFIVSANGVDIKVLGTSFNVYSYAKENMNRISLIEGELIIYDQASSDKKVTLHPLDEATIKNHTMKVGKIRNQDYFLWKEGIYSFENEPLENVFKMLELYFDINFEVKDPVILKWKYTLKFRQRDGIDEIMRLLCKVYPLKVRKIEELNTVIVSR